MIELSRIFLFGGKAITSHSNVGATSFDVGASSFEVNVSQASCSRRHESVIVAYDSPKALEVHVVDPSVVVPHVFPEGTLDLSLFPLNSDHVVRHMRDGEVT